MVHDLYTVAYIQYIAYIYVYIYTIVAYTYTVYHIYNKEIFVLETSVYVLPMVVLPSVLTTHYYISIITTFH